MPATLIVTWLLLTLLIVVLERSKLGFEHFRWGITVAIAVAVAICLGTTWMSVPGALARWGSGLAFDSLSQLILPSVSATAGATLLFTLYTAPHKWLLPLEALLAAVVTAGVVSSTPLFAIGILQVTALLVLLGLLAPGREGAADGIFRVATGLKFITMTAIGAASLTVALILQSFYAVNPDHLALPRIVVALLIVGCGVTLAAMPFYFHLPDLFDAAPPAISALLVGPGQALAFVYLLRTLDNGPWLLADQHVIDILVFGGVVAALLAGLLAFNQPTCSRLLAFTSIQEVGWLAFGIASDTQVGWTGALVFLAARSVAKPMLVLSAAMMKHGADEMSGAKGARLTLSSPLTATVWLVGVLTLIGFPGTAGFWGVKALTQAAFETSPAVLTLFLVSILMTASVYARATWRMVVGGREEGHRIAEGLSLPSILLVGLAASLVLAGFLPSLFQEAVSQVTASISFLR